MKKLKWEGSVYEVKELNAKEYIGIDRIIRDAKDIKADEPLVMDGGEFTLGLIVACATKDGKPLKWEHIEGMPAKLFQAISNMATKLNTLMPKEEEALFFESSTVEDV